MFDRVKKSFNEGVRNVKWIASFLAERTRTETNVAKLLYECNKLEAKLDNLYREVGRRVLELKDREDKPVYKDFIVLQTMNEITKLQEEIDDYKKRAHELSKIKVASDNPS